MNSWKARTGFLFILLFGVCNPSPAKELEVTRQLPDRIVAQFADEFEKCAANFLYLASKEVRKFNKEGFKKYKSKSGGARARAANFREVLIFRDDNDANFSEALDRSDEIAKQNIKAYLKAIERRSPEGLDIISDKSTTRCQRASETSCLFFWELGYVCGPHGRFYE